MSKVESKLISVLLDCTYPVRSYNGKLSIKTLDNIQTLLSDIYITILYNYRDNMVLMCELIALLKKVETVSIDGCNIFYFPDINY